MALRIRRMTVYGPSTLSAGLTEIRTKMVRCRGAKKVAFILSATEAHPLPSVKAWGTMNSTADADPNHFDELTPGVLGVRGGTSDPVGDMSRGGTLLELAPDLGDAMCLEQIELHFDSDPTTPHTVFKVTCEVQDEVGSDDANSLLVSN